MGAHADAQHDRSGHRTAWAKTSRVAWRGPHQPCVRKAGRDGTGREGNVHLRIPARRQGQPEGGPVPIKRRIGLVQKTALPVGRRLS